MRHKKWLEEIDRLERGTSADYARKDRKCDRRILLRRSTVQFEEAIIVTDVGQHQMFTTQYIEITTCRSSLLTSGGLGTMGYGFPGAIGARIGKSG